jgi:hypothetical protein
MRHQQLYQRLPAILEVEGHSLVRIDGGGGRHDDHGHVHALRVQAMPAQHHGVGAWVLHLGEHARRQVDAVLDAAALGESRCAKRVEVGY